MVLTRTAAEQTTNSCFKKYEKHSWYVNLLGFILSTTRSNKEQTERELPLDKDLRWKCPIFLLKKLFDNCTFEFCVTAAGHKHLGQISGLSLYFPQCSSGNLWVRLRASNLQPCRYETGYQTTAQSQAHPHIFCRM